MIRPCKKPGPERAGDGTGSFRNSVAWTSLRILLAAAVGLAARVSTTAATAAPAIPETPLTVWESVDMVPMPKRMRLTGTDLVLDRRTVLVLGTNASEQDVIGAAWINTEIVRHGGEPLQTVRTTADLGAGAVAIVIGTRESCAWIATAAARGVVDVGPENPGRRGYEIRIAADEAQVCLAGADPIGALYACVTFAELLKKTGETVSWRVAEVRDYPDYRTSTFVGPPGSDEAPEFPHLGILTVADPTDKQRQAYLDGVRAYCDWMLRHKVSRFLYGFYWRFGRVQDAKPGGMAVAREGIGYGTKRGIQAYMGCKPFVGLKRNFPDVKTEIGGNNMHSTYDPWIRGWAPRLDATRKEYAANLARFGAALGIKGYWFHDTDTGGFYSPARWNERAQESRDRWGDDYAAAVIHKHMIFVNALTAATPDADITFVIYPYSLEIFSDESGYPEALVDRYRKFWRRLDAAFPDCVVVPHDNAPPESVQRFRRYWTKGVEVNMKGDKIWQTFFTEFPRHMISFCRHPNDRVRIWPRGEGFVPLQCLVGQEYAWNTRAPGAAPFEALSEKFGDEIWKQGWGDNETFTVVLPHVVRNIFGRDAAPDILEALRQNVSFTQIFNPIQPARRYVLTTYERIAWQCDAAERAAAALDRLWDRHREAGSALGMDAFGFRRFVYMREVMHTCMWLARLQKQNRLAQKLAREQDVTAAVAAIEQGKQWVIDARAALQRLIEDRPNDPVITMPPRRPESRIPTLHTFMADGIVNLDLFEARLEQTRRELHEFSPVPEPVLKQLLGTRRLRAVQSEIPWVVDGSLDEPAWREAYPIETFLVARHGNRIAQADTRVLMLYDQTTLVIGAECRTPGGGRVRASVETTTEDVLEDDSFEIFLKPTAMDGDYVHLMMNATGTIRHQRCRDLGDEHPERDRWKPDNDWVCPGLQIKTRIREGMWTVEAAIPLSSLDMDEPGGWMTGNFCRNCPFPGGQREPSSTLPPEADGFHQPRLFRPVVWCGDHGFSPQVQIEAPGFRPKTRTFNDGIATAAGFDLLVTANRLLHNVTVWAESYSPDGRLQKRVTLAKQPKIAYEWAGRELTEVAFREQLESGGVKVLLASDEGVYDRWFRFGDWHGDRGEGTVFEDPDPGPGMAAADFRTTQHLGAAVNFPSAIAVDSNDVNVNLFASCRGTVECWVKPAWDGRFPPPAYHKNPYSFLNRVFLHMGVPNMYHPEKAWPPSFKIGYAGVYGNLGATVLSGRNVSWGTSVYLKQNLGWRAGVWHHVALVWDAQAHPDRWLRLYLDGKPAPAATRLMHADRLGDDKSVRMTVDRAYPVQIGCLTTGRLPAGATFDELRISRVARYDNAFAPSYAEHEADAHTTALFHFNGHLEGTGVTEAGKRYTVRAQPGAVAYH